MKKYLCLLFICACIFSQAQNRLLCRTASVKFVSTTPLENIEATNNSGLSVIDTESGKIEFAVLLKGFAFRNALMQEHFNENYMESDKFPRAVFKGSIENISKDIFTKEGNYPITIKGEMLLHGKAKPISIQANISNQKSGIIGECNFEILPSDYDIQIPKLVADKIAQRVTVVVKAIYQVQKK